MHLSEKAMASCYVNGRILVAMTRTVITAVSIYSWYKLHVFVRLSTVIKSMNYILRLIQCVCYHCLVLLLWWYYLAAIAEAGNF